MNKRIFPILIVVATLMAALLPACQSSVDSSEEWRRRNEKAFADYESKSEYKKVTTDGSLPYVFMKTKTKGTGTEHPISTSRVIIHYAMYLLVSTSSTGTAPLDGNFDQEQGLRLSLNRGEKQRAIAGMQIALQNMVVGDHTEVIIPWYLAYGAKTTKSQNINIAGYSALRYEIRLDSIVPESAE